LEVNTAEKIRLIQQIARMMGEEAEKMPPLECPHTIGPKTIEAAFKRIHELTNEILREGESE
jgi:hypothetical protein